ncbi:MAG: protein-L-isoaspartate O-methyltransferase [Patescibacteria group bacterium]
MDELIHELKQQGVLRSPHVEAAFRAIDRKDFVLPEYRNEAYGNYPLPIGEGQTISQPYVVAFMLDLLDPKPGEKILDVGTGSGWTTALLAEIVSREPNKKIKMENKKLGRVFAIERISEIFKFGKANVAKYNFIKKGVVKFLYQDGTAGLAEEGPFDKILASAAAMGALPTAWRDQTKIGGAIVAPVESSVWRYVKEQEGRWAETEYPGFAFVPLVKNGRGKGS